MSMILATSSFGFGAFILPLLICVVLPCVIVFLITSSRKHELDKRAELAMKAIDKGINIDSNLIALGYTSRSIKEMTFRKLIIGIVLLALGLGLLFYCYCFEHPDKLDFAHPVLIFAGIAFIIIYFIAKKKFAKEISEEENK